MTPRLVILTEIISPYRIPLFNALHDGGGVKLHVVFLAETDPNLRQWRIYKENIRFSYQILSSWRMRLGRYNLLLNRGLGQALNEASPDAILCGGYNYVASWQALDWARSRGVPFLLWSESNLQDIRRGHALVEMLKSEFLNRCNGFVVPGRTAFKYLRRYKIPEDEIFTAVNAVDNELFAATGTRASRAAGANRAQLGLPQRYFLYVGRLVREKGVFDLVSAYAKLDEHLKQQVGLVFVGDGPVRQELEAFAGRVTAGNVKFVGFVHQENLAKYYALAEMLILPTYTDPWGLVVNEAMACGLPVVLSRVAGCAADLVTENWNGFLVSPGDIFSLSSSMTIIANQESLRAAMCNNSLQRISGYTAKQWSCGITRAVDTVVGSND